MAEAEETRCIRLELSNGGHVYLRSIWETANFSIVVFDGFQAWSRSVSTKEVTSIARQWNIDVGDFMRSARARLSCQHPTSSYSMSAEEDVVNLSFILDDLWEGEALDFKLRMEGISDVRPVVCEMLDYLVDTNRKLKEQLVEAETQFQKKVRQLAAASEAEPSITLSLTRSSGSNPRRQSSSFMEPRLLDFPKFKSLEDRDATRPGCTPPTRAHGQPLLHDTSKTRQPSSSFDLQDHGITKQTPKGNSEMEREVSYFPRSGAPHGGRIVRNNDLTVNMVALSPNIMRVLHSLSSGIERSHGDQNLQNCRNEELDMGAGSRDERGLKITEMESPPRREDQPQRSFMLETNSVSTTGFVSAQSLRPKITTPEKSQPKYDSEIARDSSRAVKDTGTVAEDRAYKKSQPKYDSEIARDSSRALKDTGAVAEDRAYKKSEAMIWNTPYCGVKKVQENHNGNDVSGVVLEKSGSNVGDLERSQLRSLSKYATNVEAKEAGSDEERTSKATLEDAHRGRSALDSNLRVKAGLPAQFSWGPRLNEAKSPEEKREKCQHPQNTTTDREPRSASGRQESPAETIGKQSSVTQQSLWNKNMMDAGVTTPSATKREKPLLVTDSYTEEEETPEYARHKSRPLGVEHQGRKRSMENREDDSRNKGSRPVKLEADDSDLEGTEGTRGSRKVTGRSTRKPHRNVKQEELEVDDYSEETKMADKLKMRRESSQKKQDGDPSDHTLLETLREKRRKTHAKTHAKAAFRPPEKKHRHGDHDDRSPHDEMNVVETNVPDPDYYNFDRDRTEDLVKANQVWAVYDEKDEMPRAYARIDMVFSSPKFEAAVTWLKPHQPSEEAKQWSELSGYSISCGEFEYSGQYTLTEINCFSHKMVVGSVSGKGLEIYPRKGEVWALFKNMEKHSTTTTSDARIPKAQFRLAEILEDVEAGKLPRIQVLGRVPRFRTVWKAYYVGGNLPTTNLTLFSHRVPAYQLQGHELPNVSKGSWDIDPAGLPPCESQRAM